MYVERESLPCLRQVAFGYGINKPIFAYKAPILTDVVDVLHQTVQPHGIGELPAEIVLEARGPSVGKVDVDRGALVGAPGQHGHKGTALIEIDVGVDEDVPVAVALGVYPDIGVVEGKYCLRRETKLL
ncbi:hypothetical protein D3C71_1748100 [compost metagenome]